MKLLSVYGSVISMWFSVACAPLVSSVPDAAGPPVGERTEATAVPEYDKRLISAIYDERLNTDPCQLQRLVDIANRLIPHASRLQRPAAGWTWELNLLDSDDINAECMIGGKIFVHSGLLDDWQLDDTQLAAVLAHAIAYVLCRSDDDAGDAGYAENAEAAAPWRYRLSDGLACDGEAVKIQIEADRLGIELMARAGYDPEAALVFWHRVAFFTGPDKEARQGLQRSRVLCERNRLEKLHAAVHRYKPLYRAALVSAEQARTFRHFSVGSPDFRCRGR